MKKNVLFIGLCISVLIPLFHCGVSNKTLEDAEQRINVLREKGVPDSSLSTAIVFLYQAKDAKVRGNFGPAKQATDSMLLLIAKAEEKHTQDMIKLKPSVDSLRNIFQNSRSELTGLHLKRLDSAVAVIDSFATINWLLQAQAKAEELITLLETRIKFDEKRAKELRPRVLGKWVCTNITKSKENKDVNAIEKKIFSFRKNGKTSLIEKKSGQSGNFLKENWEFHSWGTYDLIGDTIVLAINRFASLRQNFEELHINNNKKKWEKKIGPIYDSVITDGSQDRYITFSDLKEDFIKQ